ncbi:MAG TPA: hypothetical protein DCE42_13995 [Myxococcales bacterium]|nr:hypothetical protein [Deltaproteobacteria bacterium]HAA55870.1 hypothetical protein [Myxococcales bacterium]
MTHSPTKQMNTLPNPDVKVYSLQVGAKKKIPLTDNTALVYQFHVQVQQDGLYAFETFGESNTLCALVRTHKQTEHFLIVRDTGGKDENCRLIWAFPPGKHRFKVRVDGSGHFFAKLSKINWKRLENNTLPQDNKIFSGTLEGIKDRHRFRFHLRSPRLIYIKVKGKHQMQCMLRAASGKWLSEPGFRQNYGSCVVGRWLQPGEYHFELRSNQPQNAYKLSFQMVRMQDLQTGHIREGFIQRDIFDLYRFQLRANRRHLLQTHGTQALRCQLEDQLGHVIQTAQLAEDGKNCLLSGQFPPGQYFVRIQLRRGTGGHYLISLQQQTYTALHPNMKKQIAPSFQQHMQLYRIQVKEARLYQFSLLGRAMRCVLHSSKNKKPFLMDLSKDDGCMIYAHLQRGVYFLQAYPKTRREKPYKLAMLAYRPASGQRLNNTTPRLMGPSYRGFVRNLQLDVKHPELTVIETHGNIDTNCSLYDNKGKQLLYDDDGGKRYNCRITRYLKPGRYRLKIKVGRIPRASRGGERLFWVQRVTKTIPWLVLGQPVKGTLASKAKPQTYLLKVPQTGMFGIRTTGSTDTKCFLLNNDWKQIAMDDDSGTDRNCFMTSVLSPGVYPLQIKMYRTPGPFTLLVDYLRPKLMVSGQPIRDLLKAPNWMHFYRVDINTRGLYSLQTKGNVDTQCTLLNDLGKKVAHNDDGKTGDKNCALMLNLERGTYYFQVKLFRSKRSRLRRQFGYQALFDKLTLTSEVLSVGKNKAAHLPQGGIKEFSFKIQTSGHYNIETRGRNADPKCVLMDRKTRKIITKDDDSGFARNCRMRLNLSPGEYIVQIRTASNSKYSTGKFSIGVHPHK